jgi:hypothetical protein
LWRHGRRLQRVQHIRSQAELNAAGRGYAIHLGERLRGAGAVAGRYLESPYLVTVDVDILHSIGDRDGSGRQTERIDKGDQLARRRRDRVPREILISEPCQREY